MVSNDEIAQAIDYSLLNPALTDKDIKEGNKMIKIKGLKRLDNTILAPSGNGDNWHMTWAKDDIQYVGLCDGKGWENLEGYTDLEYNSRIFTISGNAPNYSFGHLNGYPLLESIWTLNTEGPKHFSRYYGFGILALDGFIYHFLSTPKVPFGALDNSFIGVKLIYSDDNGQTWKNQDGSSPVIWEEWGRRSRENMLFFYELDDAFSLLTVLQMGKNYDLNKDGYVYIYALNGNTVSTMNQLVMFRVKKDKILDRSGYEYFVSLNPDGTAKWNNEINQRSIVHTFPEGWVNWKIGGSFGGHPYSWQPSVIYNEPLDTYIMASWGMGVSSEGDWFGKPSYLGFWTAKYPWGPWSQIHEEVSWTPNNDWTARAYQPQISPKWIAKDGRSFWLIWTDFRLVGTKRPYYAFNCQKVLIVTE
ncbi:MAG: DUF4185 domain-containing protein [Actinobacteria bacterium]|nr:DUF4185 domain-containing protein [Actinomycetota bacterium]